MQKLEREREKKRKKCGVRLLLLKRGVAYARPQEIRSAG